MLSKDEQAAEWGEAPEVTVTGRKKTQPVLQNISLPEPEAVREVHRKANALPERARAMTIKTNLGYISATDFLKNIKGLRAEIDAAFDPIISKAHEAHKEALSQKKKAEAPLVEAEGVVKKLVLGWLNEQERLRREEEARVRQEYEDKIRKQAEEDNLKRAQELAEQGDMDGAAEAVDAEVVVPDIPIKVESTVPKVEGIGKRKLYSAEVRDLMALVKAVAAGTVPMEAVEANHVFLNRQASAYKKEGPLYPGVVIVGKDSLASSKG